MEDDDAAEAGSGADRGEAEGGAAHPSLHAAVDQLPGSEPQRLRMSLAATNGLTLTPSASEHLAAGATVHSELPRAADSSSPQDGRSSSSHTAERGSSKAAQRGDSYTRVGAAGVGEEMERDEETAAPAPSPGARARSSAHYSEARMGASPGHGGRQGAGSASSPAHRRTAEGSGSDVSAGSDASDASSTYMASTDGHDFSREDRKLRRKWRRILGLKCYVRASPLVTARAAPLTLTPRAQVPDLVWRRALQDAAVSPPPPLLPYCARERCAVMLADISGFTPLTVRAHGTRAPARWRASPCARFRSACPSSGPGAQSCYPRPSTATFPG